MRLRRTTSKAIAVVLEVELDQSNGRKPLALPLLLPLAGLAAAAVALKS
jgi:hypothetical protein